MARQYQKILCGCIFSLMSFSSTAFAQVDDSSNMLYRSPSVFNNGHFYVQVDGAYALTLLSFNTTTSLGSLDKKSRRVSNLAVDLGLGYAFSPQFAAPIRVEALFIGRPSKKMTFNPFITGASNRATASLSTTQILGNVYYDFLSSGDTELIPYVGGGLGFASGKGKLSVTDANGNALYTNSSASKNHLAWDLEAGLRGELTSSVDLGAFVRFNNLGNYTFAATPIAGGNPVSFKTKNAYAIDLGFGVTFNFG
ncbi:MAG: outer membrane beta-barrel protein [Legionellales bacterium]|nr:outer membrane beta-barrel protein [Legionellales bacterium]